MQVRLAVFAVGAVACGDNIQPQPRVAGQVFSDDNGNGVRDDGEAGIEGIEVRATLRGGLETIAVSDVDGNYTIQLPSIGTYDIVQQLPFGFRKSRGQAKRVPIIGGTDSAANQYGFMVSVASKFSGGAFPFCGGVLISDRHVVTAAHCSAGEDAQDVAVIAGTLDPFNGSDGQIFDVEEVLIHPEFDGDPGNGFDISLWTLAEPIDLATANLTTVEMVTPATARFTANGVLATTLGWGVSDSSSPLMQQVHVPLVAEAVCAEEYQDAQAFETQICAGAAEGGIDSCQGDSGGPLLVRDTDRDVWLHAGITSYGNGCALPGVPGVYGRLETLSAWAMSEASEPTGSAIFEFTALGQIAIVDFPTESTTRPQPGEIAQRWQLTATSLPDQVAENTPVDVHFAILAEDPAMTGFNCTFDPDLTDAIAGTAIACGVGATDHSFAGFPTGIFGAEVEVTRAGDEISYRRRVNVFSGSPPSTTSAGTLTINDPLDPDYGQPFRVDYFNITNTTGKAFAIEAESEQFSMFLTLYDLAERDFVNGGGILAFGDRISQDGVRLIVLPEAGTSYVVGVSTNGQNEIGDYTIKIINDGTLTPR